MSHRPRRPVDRHRRAGQYQQPARTGVAERRQRQHAGLRGRDRHAAERHCRWPRARGSHRPADPQHRYHACRPSCSARTRPSPACRPSRRALQAIDAAQGTPGQGYRHRQPAWQVCRTSSRPCSTTRAAQPQQSQVVSTAQALAQGINALSDTYTTQRQTAEDSVVRRVSHAQRHARHASALSNKIVTLKASGQSTADLENQRDAAVANLSQLVDIKVAATAQRR